MKIESGEILNKKCNAVALPTSAYLVFNGISQVAFLDEGVSQKFGELWPPIKTRVGETIKKSGNFVFLLTGSPERGYNFKPMISSYYPPFHILNFPVKPGRVLTSDAGDQIQEKYRRRITRGKTVPGYMMKPNKGIVEESIKELQEFVNKTPWSRICIPALNDEDANDLLIASLDDKYVLVRR